MRLVVFAALFLTATSALADRNTCQMKSITQCEDANTLIWAKSFGPALSRFAGSQKVRWLGTRMPLSEVVTEVLGGGGDARQEVAPGIYRFAAFRPHSATERGAIFIAADGTIKAAGVLHFNCAKRCESTYNLAILLKKPNAELEKLVKAWGDQETKSNADNGYEADLTTIAHTEVVLVKR